ncbi:hypothetical protein BGZ98_005943 [Dissophora globulifera]|uniref:tRNA (guanine(10)-N(2))-methyltransferase n=1 Tax=Dissophora globulifera TaxID=979702 RepID=A0A9P6RXT5_9FUNG|nr:hypothetical protein BGZ98_005943 [Dissophora globulifera]KAG0330486.1 hypothetical protein BGZ99_003057 [Dissophora globulifera]
MPQFLIQFAQQHEEFRLPELEALATIENVRMTYNPDAYSLESPFLIVEIESAEKAAQLLNRAILIKTITELWGTGLSWEELIDRVKEHPERWPQYLQVPFKFSVVGFGGTIEMKDKPELIDRFAFTGFMGKIDLKNPEEEFLLIADYGIDPNVKIAHTFYMGRLIGHGKRDLIEKFNVKKRRYIGNTTMDAELSLIMANQALCGPGKLVYDPFVGTGSFLMTCAHFGATTVGSDIDGRQIRGKGKASIQSNSEQYGVKDRVLDALVFDVCHAPWRRVKGGLFDAIVTDPPYGVRAGAKTLGRKDPTKQATGPRMAVEEGVHAHLLPDYVPPTKPYEMSEVVADLLMFAVKNLVRGGRLVYWLPTVTEDYTIDDLPTHPCMELISNCEQAFGQWSRRLITMEKIKDWDGQAVALGPPTGDMNKSTTNPKQQGHFGFRDRYFAFGIVENAKRKKELKEAYHKGGPAAVAAYMKQIEQKKKEEENQQQE